LRKLPEIAPPVIGPSAAAGETRAARDENEPPLGFFSALRPPGSAVASRFAGAVVVNGL